MSPEQASAGEIDGRSDLFSAGLILYELVTGEKAYHADSLVAILYKILHEAPDLALIPQGTQWERLRAVLARALARKAEERYPDARAMSAELAQALSDLGGTLDWTAPADQALLVRPRPRTAPRVEPPGAPAAPLPPPVRPAAPARSAPDSPPAAARRSSVAARLGAAALVAIVATGLWLWLRPGAAPLPPPSPAPSITPTAIASAEAPASAPAATPAATALPLPTATPGATPAPTVRPESEPTPTPPPAATPGLGPEARLLRADDLVGRGRWADALAEARAVLDAQPNNARAAALAQQAEAELVIEECLRSARAALRDGDRERALEEVRRGFMVRKNDARLLAMHREVVAQ
jgi:serine/threonine-protein kinase